MTQWLVIDGQISAQHRNMMSGRLIKPHFNHAQLPTQQWVQDVFVLVADEVVLTTKSELRLKTL